MRLLAPLGLATLALVTFACSSGRAVVEESGDDDDGASSPNRPGSEGSGSSSGNAGSSSGGQPAGSSSGGSSGTTPPGTSGDLAARTYIEQRFACLGLQPGGTSGYMMPFTNAGGTPTANVVAILPGSDPVLSKEFVVMSAHHDHFGTVGNKGLRRSTRSSTS